MMLMWSVVVLLPALPGRNAKANGSPVPAWPWSTNAQNGWCPKPFLYGLFAVRGEGVALR